MELNLEICRTSLAIRRSFSKFTCKKIKEKNCFSVKPRICAGKNDTKKLRLTSPSTMLSFPRWMNVKSLVITGKNGI